MALGIEEIYDLFLWNSSYTEEEYAAREAKGISQARQLKNIFPFIQPIIIPADKSKSVWEPCAKVIALRSDEELQPFLHLLFEWLQDMNWPGADIIFNRLAQMPFPEIESELCFSRKRAEKANDKMWLHWLDEFEQKAKSSNTGL